VLRLPEAPDERVVELLERDAPQRLGPEDVKEPGRGADHPSLDLDRREPARVETDQGVEHVEEDGLVGRRPPGSRACGPAGRGPPDPPRSGRGRLTAPRLARRGRPPPWWPASVAFPPRSAS